MKNRVVVYSKEYLGQWRYLDKEYFLLFGHSTFLKTNPCQVDGPIYIPYYESMKFMGMDGVSELAPYAEISLRRFHPISPCVSLAHPSIWLLHPFSKTNGSIARVNLVAIFRDCFTFVSQMGCNFFVVCLDAFSYSNTFPHSNEFWRIYPPENQSSTSPKRGRAFLKITFILDVIVSGLGFSVRVGF